MLLWPVLMSCARKPGTGSAFAVKVGGWWLISKVCGGVVEVQEPEVHCLTGTLHMKVGTALDISNVQHLCIAQHLSVRSQPKALMYHDS